VTATIQRQCNDPECDRPLIARGMCSMHYQRWKYHNPRATTPSLKGVPAVERLLSRCIEDNGCWLYTGNLDRKGYVRVRRDRGTKAYGHRIIWEHYNGRWPDGLTYDHLCRRKNCLNPQHGEPVTAAVNTQRRYALVTQCPQGHPYSGSNLRYASRGYGRVCKVCRAESNRAYRARKMARRG
jgi:hypothetical protein